MAAYLLMPLLLLAACAGAAPSPSPVAPPAAATEDVETPAARPSAAQALLDKVVEGFGGAERVDGLRTLVVESTMTRIPEGGQETTISQRSYVALPDRFRREAILEGGMTVASVVGPGGAFVVSPLGVLPLPEEERAAMERGFARTPLSLLRSREDDTFEATADGEGELDGRPVEYLEIVHDGDRHRLAVNRETGHVLEMRFSAPAQGAAEGETREVAIRYQDHREVDGLVYPFRSTTTSTGEPTITQTIHSVQVDVEIDPARFEPPEMPAEEPSAPETPDPAQEATPAQEDPDVDESAGDGRREQP